MKRKYTKAEREHFAKITRRFIEEDAYRALSSHAKALYVVLKFEWKGPRANNNGCITFSVRQAAEALGISPDTAAKAFYDLQAKGFIVVTEIGHPGVWGLAKGNQYELTELPLPGQREGRHLYRNWRPGRDFDVLKANAHNPKGYNGITRKPGPGLAVQVT